MIFVTLSPQESRVVFQILIFKCPTVFGFKISLWFMKTPKALAYAKAFGVFLMVVYSVKVFCVYSPELEHKTINYMSKKFFVRPLGLEPRTTEV